MAYRKATRLIGAAEDSRIGVTDGRQAVGVVCRQTMIRNRSSVGPVALASCFEGRVPR
jgi:hypothetical protein